MRDTLFTRLLGGIAQRISALAQRLTARVAAFIKGKERVKHRDLVDLMREEFDGPYVAELAEAMSEVTGERITRKAMREYLVGEVTLSRRLYQQAGQTASRVQQIVQAHTRYGHDARKLALELYEGYGFRADEVLKPIVRLPGYLNDASLNGGMDALLARIQAANLKTPALRAAYLDALDRIIRDKGAKAIDRALDVAVQERYRYFANRIAQTELARAQNNQRAREIMADDEIQAVRFQMSVTHPAYDLCDLYARMDRYGLGPGIYPKGLAPNPPVHPFCRCHIVPLLGVSAANAREIPDAARRVLFFADPKDAARMAGSRAKRDAMFEGSDPEAIYNAGRPDGYRIRTMGDVDRED